MKVYAEFDDGKKVELREIQGLQPDCEIVFVRANVRLRLSDIEKIEKQLSEKIGKRIVLLDDIFGEVFVM